MSPEQIPVAVPDLELTSPVQHQSQTSPKNTLVKAERRYPGGERKPQKSLTCDFKNIQG